MRCGRVFRHVRESFRRDVVRHQCGLGREWLWVDLGFDRDGGALRQRVDGGGEAAFDEQGGVGAA